MAVINLLERCFMPQAITIELPDTLFEQLQRTAALTRLPLQTLVEQSLSHSLPPILEDVPKQYQAEVYPLLEMSDKELVSESRRTFPRERWRRYELLLEKKKEQGLTASEQVELDSLRREADVLMFRKGYAAVLLKRRGYRLPSLQELERTM